jgi:hypothetical protein
MGCSGAWIAVASLDPAVLVEFRKRLEQAGITPITYTGFQLGLGEKLHGPEQETSES